MEGSCSYVDHNIRMKIDGNISDCYNLISGLQLVTKNFIKLYKFHCFLLKKMKF